MNLCSDGHVEICHEEQKCPICLIIIDINDEHETSVGELNDQIDLLETEVDELNAKLHILALK